MKAQVIEDVTLLANGDVYGSGIRDMTLVARDFSAAFVFFHAAVDSDQDGTAQLYQSTDQEVWDELGPDAPYTGASGVLEISSQATQRYVRAEFTNTGTTQEYFTMTTGVDQS